MAKVLSATGISVSFGGLHAVQGMSVEVSTGQIVGIIGPNGAGKSTFFNTITGHQPVNAGHIEFLGQEVTHLPPHRRARMGMARTFQLGGLIEDLTALENVVLGLDHELRAGSTSANNNLLAQRAMIYLERFNLGAVAREIVGNLAAGIRRQVEVARTIAAGAHLILLDEPGAGLSETDHHQLADMIRGLARENKSFLLTDHSTDFVFAVSDYIRVMNFGELIAQGTPDEIKENPEVMEAYLGKAVVG